MGEFWKAISCCTVKHSDGHFKYEVSNHGHIRISGWLDKKCRWHEPHVMSIRKHKSCGLWYCEVRDENGEKVRLYVHKLVAEAFVPNPDGLTVVEHKDGDLDNNFYRNLQWGRTRGRDSYSRQSSKSAKPVRQYTLDGEFVAEYPTVAAAAKAVYVKNGGFISQCCRRLPKHKTCGGYIWRYVEDDEFFSASGGVVNESGDLEVCSR